MLKITIPENELFDPKTREFITIKEQTITLEHSLLSISKWEGKWKKPFIDRPQMAKEESRDYVRCMTLTQNVNPLVYLGITPEIMAEINSYIEDPMSATKIYSNVPNQKKNPNKKITAEEIYYKMISYGIPLEFEKRHLNKLIALIEVFDVKNSTKKMTPAEIRAQNRALNAARRKRR